MNINGAAFTTGIYMTQLYDQRRSEVLQGIDHKIKSGGRLSDAERDYLIRYMPDIHNVIFENKRYA